MVRSLRNGDLVPELTVIYAVLQSKNADLKTISACRNF
jgi:hypothetical protein